MIWRGTPADSPVKDQAACGSCWSFSSVGAIEAAWYRATGKQLLFSEQHMIDCGWEAGNSGCYGGWGRVCGAGVEVVVLALLLLLSLLRFASSRSGALSMPVISSLTPQQPSPPPPRLHARCCPPLPAGGDQVRILNWVFRRGALATQADYPYQGINNFCRTDVTQKRFKGEPASPQVLYQPCASVHFLRQQPAAGVTMRVGVSAPPPSAPAAGHWVLVEGGEEALKEAVLTKG